MKRPYALAILTLLGILGILHAPASWGNSSDHDRARTALAAGEIMPLRQLLEQVEKNYPGQVIEVELEHDDQRWVYEIKLLRTGGAMTKLKLDAKNGSLIKAKNKNID